MVPLVLTHGHIDTVCIFRPRCAPCAPVRSRAPIGTGPEAAVAADAACAAQELQLAFGQGLHEKHHLSSGRTGPMQGLQFFLVPQGNMKLELRSVPSPNSIETLRARSSSILASQTSIAGSLEQREVGSRSWCFWWPFCPQAKLVPRLSAQPNGPGFQPCFQIGGTSE